MSIESILDHILGEGHKQRDIIISEATEKVKTTVSEGKEAAQKIYHHILTEKAKKIEKQTQGRLIEARLENRKAILQTKQELIEQLFSELKAKLKKDRFKKLQISFEKIKETQEDIDFYLTRLRQDCETDIASILFS